MGSQWNYTPACPDEMKLNKPYAAMHLFNAVNNYRQTKGLHPIPYSRSLSYVAQTHAWDVMVNFQGKPPKGGNLHSWSGREGSRVVYSSDHRQAADMWSKPRELGTGYSGNGYEITYFCSGQPGGSVEQLADDCIKSWMGSSGHHEVMLNRGIWRTPFKAMGAGWFVNEHGVYACVWFGQENDSL